MCVFFADNENQLKQEERSFVEDPVNAHLFAEEDVIMDKRQQPRNTGPTAKRARTTTDNQDEVSYLSNNTRIITSILLSLNYVSYEQITTLLAEDDSV